MIFTLLIFTVGCENAQNGTMPREKAVSVYDLKTSADITINNALSSNVALHRTHAIEVIAKTGQSKFMPKVIELTDDDYTLVRFVSAIAIGDLKYYQGKSRLEKLLNDSDKSVQSAAAYGLAKLGDEQKANLIRANVKNKNQAVRANAALLLGKLGNQNDLKILYWALRDEDSSAAVRFQAVESIAMLGDEDIYSKIWTMLISAYADDRIMGVKSMGALKTPKARNALILMLDDPVEEVRLASAEQLGYMGEKMGEIEIIDYLSRKGGFLDPQERERKDVLAALAIGSVKTDQLKPYLYELISDRPVSVKLAAAQAVYLITR